ncbi:MAG: META domain-containing protein [Pseudomonadota bacterium]
MRIPHAALALAFLLSACAVEEETAVEEQPPVEEVVDVAPPPPPPPPERLEDATWQITHVDGLPTQNRVVLDIAGQFISGDGPCNRLTGNYLGTGPIFDVQLITSTSRPCGVQAFEEQVMLRLLEANSAEIDLDGTLRIMSPAEQVTLQFQPYYGPQEINQSG